MPRDAATLVILGATGDLSRRLLLPALYRLEAAGRLPVRSLLGTALRELDDGAFRDLAREAVESFAGPVDSKAWDRLAGKLSYRRGDLDAGGAQELAQQVEGSAIFYLALPPGHFAEAASALAAAGLAHDGEGFRRLVVEKPFGTDTESAERLNRQLHGGWAEDQIFRIDHFLGKETLQNLLVFRFANRFLEPAWNAQHIEHVQITASETLGLEGRYRYYDGIGALRDMLQNHLMQMFALTAMEPPALWDADVLRSHKVEVLRATRPVSVEAACRGQYGSGRIGGDEVPGYAEEPGIPAGSSTESFAAIRLEVDNWRWQGTPFYLRSGKRLGRDATEIAIRFREPPTRLFRETPLERCESNSLLFRIKPSEAIDLLAHAKRPGPELESRHVVLHASYREPGEEELGAYELLLLDAFEGDRTSFLRFDEVEWSWRILDGLLESWAEGDPQRYAAGSEGPAEQDRILLAGHHWRSLDEVAGE